MKKRTDRKSEKGPDEAHENPMMISEPETHEPDEVASNPKDEALRECVDKLVHVRENFLINHAEGKSALNAVIAELNAQLVKDGELPAAVAPVEDQRRSYRDPGEHDQHVAEAVGLTDSTTDYVGQD